MSYDMIEAVFRRPEMYTVSGTYGEVFAFLEGYYSGLAKDSRNWEHVEIWSQFNEFLRVELNDSLRIVRIAFYEKHGEASLEKLKEQYLKFKI